MAQAAAQPTRDLSGKKLGRYEVLLQLASGGMATVYVARAQGVAGFERLVAIKVLHPHLAHDDEFISMFLDEARLAARIRHPNVVPTLDISDSQGDGYFLVMEYIEGDHLGAVLREAARGGQRLTPPIVMRMVLDALEGLGAAHSLKDQNGNPLALVHRDISPHNILLGTDGIARITDFGVAKAEVRLSSTRDGQFKGKLAYMAPEQASNGTADQRSDLFSMGIVFWESLTGRRLFRADNNGELLNRLLNSPIPLLSEIAPELGPLDEVLKKALCREPAERYQTASEFLEAIEAAAPSIGGVASPRQVGKVVREWMGTKIEAESGRIRTSIDSLGRSQVSSNGTVPRPEGSALTPVTVSAVLPGGTPSEVRPIRAEDMTMGAKPSTLSAPTPQAPANRGAVYAGLGVVIVLLLGGLIWALLGRSSAPETPTALVAPALVRAPPAVEPAVVVAAPVVTTPPVVATPEVIPPTPAEIDPALPPGREPHRGRHRPPPRTGEQQDDDDLLVNPYRH